MSSNKKVLITGSSGFLGSHVVDSLYNSGYEVVLFDQYPCSYNTCNHKEYTADLFDNDAITEAVKGCDYVFHFAAQADIDSSAKNPGDTLKTNILGTHNLLDASVKHGVKRFIFASTIYVYSELGSFYRISKQACEKVIEEYNRAFSLNYTILRYGSLYGPRANEFNFIYNAVRQALESSTIIRRGDGLEQREYIHVKDAADLTVQVLREDYKNKHLTITGTQKLRVKELLDLINEILGDKVDIIFENDSDYDHYRITPYSYKPTVAKKITPSSHIDLGQGILELIHTISEAEKQGIDLRSK